MPILTSIQKTIVESEDFATGSSDLVLSIPLTTGETITFTAERQFFTPRQIATNKSDVLGLPSESVVSYTSNLIPIVKMPIGAVDITTPQYYPVTIVSDVYQNIPIDNLFRELVDDFTLPDDATFNTLRDQRNAALEAALSLDDLNAAAAVGDIDAFDEANQAIDEGLASAIEAPTPNPEEILTPEEAEELAALDLVGLTDDYGETDAAADIVDPVPEVLDDELIQRIPRVSGRIKGTEVINQAINLLNTGIKQVEDATTTGVDENGDCKFITIAKAKKGFLGVGKKSSRKIKREDVKNRMKTIDDEISKQNASNAPSPGYYVKKNGVVAFNNAKLALDADKTKVKIQNFGKAGQIGISPILAIKYVVYTPRVNDTVAFDTTVGSNADSVRQRKGPRALSDKVINSQYIPMNKSDILYYLNALKRPLQKILDKECN